MLEYLERIQPLKKKDGISKSSIIAEERRI